jgi:hypothetical protein
MNDRLRKGMWVLYEGRVGILVKFNSELDAEVHLVNENGTTAMALPSVSLADLTQAAFNNIPEERRPDEATARRLGYL